MKLRISLFVAVVAVAGYAQHGGRPATAGAGAGMGHSTMGMSHSTESSASARGNEAHSPAALLQNNDQLTNALSKSGVALPSGDCKLHVLGSRTLASVGRLCTSATT